MSIEINNLLSVCNREEFRDWLSKYYAIEKECWCIVKCGEPKSDNVF